MTEVDSVGPQHAVVRVMPQGKPIQTVEIVLDENGIGALCTCGRCGGDPCEHAIAASHALEGYLLAHPIRLWQDVLSQAIEARKPSASSAARGLLVFGIGGQGYRFRVRPFLISARVLPDELPEAPAELARFLYDVRLHRRAREVHSRSDFGGIRNASSDLVAATALLTAGSFYYHEESAIKMAAPLLAACPVFRIDMDGELGAPIEVDSEKARLVVISERVPEGVRLSLAVRRHGRSETEPLRDAQIVARSPTWLLSDTALFSISQPVELVQAFLSDDGLTIPEDEIAEFTKEYLIPLAEQVETAGHFGISREVREAAVKRVYLQEGEEGLVARLAFGYADIELAFAPHAPEYSVSLRPDGSLARVCRQPEVEDAAWRAMSGFGLKRAATPGEFMLRKGVTAVDFLIHQIPRLVEAGYQIFGEEAITSVRVNRARPLLSLSVSSGIDWFDLEAVVKFGELDASWKDVAKAIRRRERYIKLADGSVGMLPADWIERYRRLLGLVGDEAGKMRVGSHQVTVLDELLRDADDPRVDDEFRRRCERLRDLTRIESQPVPSGFRGELRAYQKAGFDWLHCLHEYGLGGCLADDMGTGKTIQALALLQSLKERGEATAPSLIVMPRSLLFNWQREAARFTPELRTLIYADGQRDQTLAELSEYDVILTTYGVMLRDIEALSSYRFHYAILDESQAIKNPLSQTARAARRLQADHRLALTGTPVENTTLELWSQFAFLNPGLLGSLEFFRKEFALPIENQRNEETASLLRRLVFPFILRRTKAQIATDLPPRTERVVYCEMEPAQRKAYERFRDYYRATLLGLIEEEGMDRARMKVLEGLLRLRQVCNHPRLVDSSFRGSSGKFSELLELLETLRAEGHKALVFSQFTQMLQLVAEALESREVPYTYLDGSTRDRSARVDEFQTNPDIPFFLISLKAGGFGLNLTAADYVIHIDPWWNPAVEMQAADRAHRIGQEKPVFVYRLIMADSVEEKVLQLQEAKRGLVAQLIQEESGIFKSLDRHDVEVLFS
ncbi:MAG TPA: DEAD/DEAH box helicase family protein [Armatimonadetes bacterium]|nr:DEAD/DEAH box helicase family protein [Armatimonadota bacterium]